MSRLLTTVISIVVVADQFTKWVIRTTFVLGQTKSVVGDIFHLSYYQNSGIAFGMLRGWSTFIIIFSFFAIGVLIWLSSKWKHSKPAIFGLGLIIGGAIGNLVDRFVIHSVIDFLDFGWNNHRWPAFNVADMCICIGVGLLIILNPQEDEEK